MLNNALFHLTFTSLCLNEVRVTDTLGAKPVPWMDQGKGPPGAPPQVTEARSDNL